MKNIKTYLIIAALAYTVLGVRAYQCSNDSTGEFIQSSQALLEEISGSVYGF